MHVKLTTDISTVKGTHHAGEVVEVDDATGKDMIERGLAEASTEAPKVATEPAPAERATLPRGRG